MVERAVVEAHFGFKVHPHMLRHACGFALASKGHDTRALHDIDLTSLVEVAKRLRSDVVTLAVMEPSSRRLAAKLEELKRALANTGIEGNLIAFHDDPDTNNADLP